MALRPRCRSAHPWGLLSAAARAWPRRQRWRGTDDGNSAIAAAASRTGVGPCGPRVGKRRWRGSWLDTALSHRMPPPVPQMECTVGPLAISLINTTRFQSVLTSRGGTQMVWPPAVRIRPPPAWAAPAPALPREVPPCRRLFLLPYIGSIHRMASLGAAQRVALGNARLLPVCRCGRDPCNPTSTTGFWITRFRSSRHRSGPPIGRRRSPPTARPILPPLLLPPPLCLTNRARTCCRAMSAAAAATIGAGPEPAAPGPAAGAALRRKHVVTAFVQRPQDGRVLVVLRSDKVRARLLLHPPPRMGALGAASGQGCCPPPPTPQVGTYKHKWGAVSGGIEGGDESPVFRCQQEASRAPAARGQG